MGMNEINASHLTYVGLLACRAKHCGEKLREASSSLLEDYLIRPDI